MAARYAAKRLAAVEVRPKRSNQHEFNAGLLRKALGIDQDKVSGPLTLLFYTDDSGAAEVDESEYTLYDSRRAKTHRSPEFRLYYKSRAVERFAQHGDLLVVQRAPRSSRLIAIIAKKDTEPERELRHAFELGDSAKLKRFVEATPHGAASGAAEALGVVRPSRGPLSPVERHPVFLDAIHRKTIPPGAVLAKAGRDLTAEHRGDRLTPDEFLFLSMEAETDLFFAIERAVHGETLARLASGGNRQFDAFIREALRIQQARRSRRGLSLQDHFRALLDREQIPYTAQCKTERGETPDFVIPSCSSYHDASFSADRLRMVACKTTVKERWRQILEEAERIPEKYLLTVDGELTPDVIATMRRKRVRIFLPRALIESSYGARGAGLETVSDLVHELRRAL